MAVVDVEVVELGRAEPGCEARLVVVRPDPEVMAGIPPVPAG